MRRTAPKACRRIALLPSHQFQRLRLWSVEESIVDDRTGQRRTPGRCPATRFDAGHPEWRAELAAAGRCPGCGTTSSPTWCCCPARPTSTPPSRRLRRSPIGPPRRWMTFVSSPRSWWKTTTSRPCAWLWSPRAGGSPRAHAATSGGSWTRHATGRIVDGLVRPVMDVACDHRVAPRSSRPSSCTPRLAEQGLQYGPFFQRIVHAQVSRFPGAGLGGRHRHRCGRLQPPGSSRRCWTAALQCVALLSRRRRSIRRRRCRAGSGATRPAVRRAARPGSCVGRHALRRQNRARRRWSPTWSSPTADGRSAGRNAPRAVPADQPAVTDAERTRRATGLSRVFEPRPPRDPDGRASHSAWPASGCCWSRPATGRSRMGPRLRRRAWHPISCSPCTAASRRGVCADRRGRTASRAGRRSPATPGRSWSSLVAATASRARRCPIRWYGSVSCRLMLTGVARAAQNVQDEALLDGGDWPIHGAGDHAGRPAGARRSENCRTWPRPLSSVPVGYCATSRHR